jgi:hypothetical protein
MLYQLAYASQAAKPMTVTELEKILVDARAGNLTRNVTGVLLYIDGVFFQLLEGEKDVVLRLLDSITKDTRHGSLKVICENEAAERAFGGWSMAYVDATPDQMSLWAGLPGTTTIGSVVADVERHPERVAQIVRNVLAVLKG